jgi:hypothetical protein
MCRLAGQIDLENDQACLHSGKFPSIVRHDGASHVSSNMITFQLPYGGLVLCVAYHNQSMTSIRHGFKTETSPMCVITRMSSGAEGGGTLREIRR